ncbi:hypothetical protein AiwAL_14375 [Acidiphilium sp. AL]|uniref:hypothetical protein n=1 Tax=Acidiphilium sp. AL TaxID=2871704 RepID=UPI0021CB496D|nr:hypothetical protein [Acidiphilium sp. AL]MCU4161275.1 hypothetical protein [Acidiphilium sp. AL]
MVVRGDRAEGMALRPVSSWRPSASRSAAGRADMIVMTIGEGNPGMDIAEAMFAGQSYTATSRNGATMKLARMLVADGCPDQPVEARGRDDGLRFTVPSLHRLARLTISEPDRGGIRAIPFRSPDFVMRGAPDGSEASPGGAEYRPCP